MIATPLTAAQNPTNAILGLVVTLLTDWLRYEPWFKWVPATSKPKIIALCVFLSAALSVVIAAHNGSLSEDLVSGLLETAWNALEVSGYSTLFHHWILKPAAPAAPVFEDHT